MSKEKDLLSGSMVALVTPFKDGVLDEARLRELVEFQIENGTSAIVPCGTTGESPTLDYDEHKRVIEVVVQTAAGRTSVIAGTGSNSTAEAIMLTKHAEKVGADAALVVVPYYNKPTQEGMIAHFKAIAASVSFPIVIYNIPGRTGVNMLPETVAQLSSVRNISGIKESTGSLDQASDIMKLCNIVVLSGDDALTLPLMAIGARGVISVAANIVPKQLSQLVGNALNGNFDAASKIHYQLLPLFRNLFVQTNPVPVKAAMAMMGMISEELRLPLIKLSDSFRPKLKALLEEQGLLRNKVMSPTLPSPQSRGA